MYPYRIYIDERKGRGGAIDAIGALCLHSGVWPGLHRQLLSAALPYRRVHWSELDDTEGATAKAMLEFFLHGPLMFFVALKRPPEFRPGMHDMAVRLVQILENSNRVPGGLHRSQTEAYLDRDTAYDESVLNRLRSFGIRYADVIVNRQSLELQLADVLLGITTLETDGLMHADPNSRRTLRKRSVLEHLRREVEHSARRGKRNAILSMSWSGDPEILFCGG